MDTTRGQKHGKGIMSYVLKQMYFGVKDRNAIVLKYFDLRNSSAWKFLKVKSEQLPEDGQVRTKHVAVDGDFNVV
jgi:hypothetical protein